MASSAGEEAPSSSPDVPNDSLVTVEGKIMVATNHGNCQQLLSKEDASTMVVVMASSNQISTPPKPPSRPAMDYRLLDAACHGSFEDLESVLNGEYHRQASSNGGSAVQQASGDVEAFLRESLLAGVTPTGDTLLHVMATYRDCTECLKKAGLIPVVKAEELLFLQNSNGDTPLHCALRATNSKMVFFLIDLASNTGRVNELLEKENQIKETALHEAVRIQDNDTVKLLMEKHPQLASFPEDGTSPLYLAILLGSKTIAKTLYEMSGGILSYSGPNGQNALHAAVLQSKDHTKMMLDWKKTDDLTMQRDEKGNTPLYSFASLHPLSSDGAQDQDRRDVCLLLVKANPDAIYQPNNNGSFPIHVAASTNSTETIKYFINKSPTCAGLRDARERTFLHVAVENGNNIVGYVCRNRSLSWILNMQDKDGNTALHLAVQEGSLSTFCPLFGNKQVHLNLTNKKGQTPLDMAVDNLRGMHNIQDSKARIPYYLNDVGAKRGICLRDYSEENDSAAQARHDEKMHVKVKDETQSLCIGSVLIATVTFGASFAMPGGYRADDHTNGGTPTLAGRYGFDAFTVANAFAFTFSTMATISLMSSGSPMIDLRSRTFNLSMAFRFMAISVTSLIAAFTLATYMILAPVAHKTAVAVCVLSSLALLYQKSELAFKTALAEAALRRRKGICSGIVWTSLLSVLCFVFVILVNL